MRIFVRLMGEGRLKNCATFTNVGGDAPLAKSTLSQHFKVLREAGLIRSERRGVELQNRTRCDELAEKFGPLVGAIIAAYAGECETAGRPDPTGGGRAPRRRAGRSDAPKPAPPVE